jgi:hypothetical protein
MPLFTEDQEQMLKDCSAEKRKRYSNEWEKNFLRSLWVQFEKGIPLTDKQDDTLNNIWDKVTING